MQKSFRCYTHGCGTFHDAHPVLTRDGERRQVYALLCPRCAQGVLDQGNPVYVEKFNGGLPVA